MTAIDPPGPLILNVDDHDAGRYAKTRVLRSAGYTVIEANRGEDALRLVAEMKPQVVLLDVKLPDVSGIDVCRRIKTDPAMSSTLVIQNSASFVGASDRVRGLEGGADSYLIAPIDPGVLVATIGAMVRLSTAERGLRATEERLRVLVDQERAAREAAERADRSKDEFVATLSHELRTPLTAILGWTSILRPKPEDVALVSKGLEVIERNSRAQLQLVEDLLDVSRIQSGKMRLEVQQIDPAAIIENAMASVEVAAEAKGIRVERTLDTPRGTITGDPARIQQIVWNLLTNAIKFTPRGGIVQVRLRGTDSHYEISVTDNGAGLDPAFLPVVFERFRQADASTTRRHGGLGIGLSLVRSLVELHGGTIRAASPGPGQGATFTVELPISTMYPAAPSPRPGPQPRKVAERGPLPTLPNVHVLAVDDEPDTRDMLVQALRQAGAVVTVVSSAEEAIEAVRTKPPAVLISDIGMPDQDGYELIRRVRAMDVRSGGAVPAIALTAMARDVDAAAAIQAGYNAHLSKPFEILDLLRAVESVLGSAPST